MRIRSVVVSGVVGVLLAGATIAFAGPAGAQAAEPCPPGQPQGRPPGGRPAVPPGQPGDRPPQYPPGKCQLRLSRATVAGGETVEVAGDGFATGSTVDIALAGRRLGTATAASTGSISTAVVVPADLAPGRHQMTATGPSALGGTQVLSASLTVTAAGGRPLGSAQPAGPAGSLPRTGSSSPVPLLLVGGALVLLGSGAVVTARRRGAGH